MAQLVDYKFWPSTLQSQAIELFANKGQMFELVEMQLSLMYDFLYTKAAVVFTWYGCFIHATITAFFMFQSSIGKNEFNRVDVIITYILVAGAVLLETTTLLELMGSTWTCALLRARRWHWLHKIVVSVRRCVRAAGRNRRWSGSIGQPELVNSPHGNGGCVSVQCLEMGCKDLWKKLHHSLAAISDGTKKLVLEEVRRMVGACEGKEEMMRSYSGQCALNPWNEFFQDPASHAGIDFDDKILSWYFATKMFFSLLPPGEECVYVGEAIRAVSNYMAFILVERPYMLPSPVRPGLYANTKATYVVGLDLPGVKRVSRRWELYRKRRLWDLDTRRDRWLADRCKELDEEREELEKRSSEARDRERGVSEENNDRRTWRSWTKEAMSCACVWNLFESSPALARGADLALGLLEVEARRMVLGVWVEMMCYASHHCSRDSHARQLNDGGEFITVVWLVSTAMFNLRYCDEPWFKKGVQEFFRPPLKSSFFWDRRFVKKVSRWFFGHRSIRVSG